MTLRDDGKYIELNDLPRFAAETAESLRRGGRVSPAGTVKAAEKQLAYIKSVTRCATAYAEKHVGIPQEVEWILDNWYIAQREGKCAAADMKSMRTLPGAYHKGRRPLVSEAAAALVASGSGKITEERIGAFLDAFQEKLCLTEAELNAFLPALRLELLSCLSEACRRLEKVLAGSADDGLKLLFADIITSLRFLSGFDASELLESVNRVERTLKLDPSGIYPGMDEETRCSYRTEIARLAAETGIGEDEAANRVLELAKSDGNGHVGYYIFTKPLGTVPKKRTGGLYIGFILLASLFLTFLIGYLLDRPGIALLLLLPVSEIVKNAADFVILRAVRPHRIQRLELNGGVPPEGRTLCVISVLLSGENSGVSAARLLEEYRLSNRDAGKNLMFGLLADLPEAKSASIPEDAPYIRRSVDEIRRLNEKFGGGFYFFTRERHFNENDGIYVGWERKRGAVLELCRLLRGLDCGLDCSEGDVSSLDGTNYIIVLDNDTRLCAGSARELIGAALHPLNRAHVDEKLGIVTEGSGILQPRVSVDLSSAGKTDFSRIFAGQGGIDPYGGVASDVYQNMFGSGSFTGKGIIDVNVYLRCLDGRFPENTILSHDLLEGAYLRCAFAGDIELTDGFPAKVTSYYDRMNRWTRGDWQLIPWLRRSVRDGSGNIVQNPLSSINKWKIADNLRRSLVPVFTFAALLMGMLLDNTDFLWAAVIAVLSAMSNLIISSAAEMFSRKREGRVRYRSAVISGFGGQLMQTLIRLILLPYEAWVCLSAVGTALYRMLISHQRLLMWVTAADSEKRIRNSLAECFYRMAPCVVLALFVIIFTPFASAAAVALIWMLSPLYVFSLGREKRADGLMDETERNFLARCAGDIWHYFDDFLTEEDNFLPPDNYQEQPAVGTAHRTSPTNIGLALLSSVAALDLGICSREKAVQTISAIFRTLRRLPKWRGHLYNWYDTITLKVLSPAYVSTVDSGNFAGSLIALREAMLELGETALAAEADSFLSDMSFTPLFDAKRQLFYIGWDVTRDEPTPGWYDLLASEARETSYIAIARGDVPRKHWRRLGRSLVSQDGYRGMVSWTGTMFEYLMPELLLPCYKNSLLYESNKFCVNAQRKGVSGIPWGMSESAFYAFDHTLSYRYKAHGVQRLALKRGMGRETVISPYSTFLALNVNAKASLRNLHRLSRLGAEGRYGFYEAVDFTPSRRRNGQFEMVRTYMAHHVGMSLISIDNVLNSGIMQRRFMRDREMAAFAELLQEKVPVGGVVLRQPPRDVPEKPQRASAPEWSFRSAGIDLMSPRCCLLGNGAYSILFTETGQSRSMWNGVMLTKTVFEQLSHDPGMSIFLLFGEKLISLTPAPLYDRNVSYSAEMSGKSGTIYAVSDGIKSSVTAVVPEDEAGEMRVVEVSSDSAIDAEIVCFFEPVLARQADYTSHPAFSKLSIETSVCDGSVIIKRRPRGKGHGFTLAFDSDMPFTFDTSREEALGRGGLHALRLALRREPGGTLGSVVDPCLLARVKVRLEPKATCRVVFSLAAADTARDASAAAKRILSLPETCSISRLDDIAHRLKMTPDQIESAMEILPEIVYPPVDRRVAEKYAAGLLRGREGMWNLGVSGDYPIITSVIDSEEDIAAAAELISVHSLISECGLTFDLVFLLTDGADYRSPLRGKIVEILRTLGLEGSISSRGGIHLADTSAEGADTVCARSVRLFDTGERSAESTRNESIVAEPFSMTVPEFRNDLEYGYEDGNSFNFRVDGKLPYNAWSHVLANRSFGYLATDSGTGHMWHLNARENKINRWENDSLSTDGTEKLELCRGGDKVTLFAAEDGFHCSVTYGFGFAEWKKDIGGAVVTTTAFVPPDVSARIFIIETENANDAEIAYFTDLVLGPDDSDALCVTTSESEGIISARNTYSTDFPNSVFTLAASERARSFTCSKFRWLTGSPGGETGTGFLQCVGTIYPANRSLVIVTGCDEPEKLAALANPVAAKAKLEETLAYWRDLTFRVKVSTPDENLNRFLNGWALYQTLACRVLGRSSLYQSGGAYGFRDQLQDVCSLIDTVPEETVLQLINAAGHQYEEGDVQHWWHPGTAKEGCGDKGVRTRCSDDLLWLPYTLCLYVEKTGDLSVCDRPVAYITSPILVEDETERYEHPQMGSCEEPLLTHAVKALNLVLDRGTGRHGLCFIGTGDWNDGMNLVGVGGEGESEWLTWFASFTASLMSVLCEKTGRALDAARYSEASEKLRQAADKAWDGGWYVRGYYDDGSPLGSNVCDECRIDSIAQSFAALAGGDAERTKTALRNSVELLYDRDSQIVRLFAPPFCGGRSTPGYIKGYSPGFRENGGQYTHGAVWLAMGLFLAGMKDEGWEILKALLPQGRPNAIYRTEPYILAADVYSGTGHVGRGGWTWYTGASGWFRRVAIENLLGLDIRDGHLSVNPNLPSSWDGFEAAWRKNGNTYEVTAKRGKPTELRVNGALQSHAEFQNSQ